MRLFDLWSLSASFAYVVFVVICLGLYGFSYLHFLLSILLILFVMLFVTQQRINIPTLSFMLMTAADVIWLFVGLLVILNQGYFPLIVSYAAMLFFWFSKIRWGIQGSSFLQQTLWATSGFYVFALIFVTYLATMGFLVSPLYALLACGILFEFVVVMLIGRGEIVGRSEEIFE